MHYSLVEFEFFWQHPSNDTELAVLQLERLKNQCLHFFSVAFELILLKLANNKEVNNILARLG